MLSEKVDRIMPYIAEQLFDLAADVGAIRSFCTGGSRRVSQSRRPRFTTPTSFWASARSA